jgi:hypothetical protein
MHVDVMKSPAGGFVGTVNYRLLDSGSQYSCIGVRNIRSQINALVYGHHRDSLTIIDVLVSICFSDMSWNVFPAVDVEVRYCRCVR